MNHPPSKKRLTRSERKRNRNGGQQDNRLNFELDRIEPLTKNQKATFDSYSQKNLMLVGTAGTGKTFLSLYLAIRDILSNNEEQPRKLVIVRSVVPTRDMGFLPGSNKEKAKVYEAPYYAIFSELFGRGDAYEYLKNRSMVEFITTSFVRGITLNDSIVVIDEFQNMDWGELTSVITRIGKNCKVIFAGDIKQSDFRFKEVDSKNDVRQFINVIKQMPNDFNVIQFGPNDIVRSGLVKNFILTVDRMGIDI